MSLFVKLATDNSITSGAIRAMLIYLSASTPEGVVTLQHQEIAKMLDVDSSTLTRYKNQLKKAGYIKTEYARVELCNSAHFAGNSAHFAGNSAHLHNGQYGNSAHFAGNSAHFAGNSAHFAGNSAHLKPHHDIHDDNDNVINDLISLGFDSPGARKLVETYEGKQPLSELLTAWVEQWPPDWPMGRIYRAIQRGDDPPAPAEEDTPADVIYTLPQASELTPQEQALQNAWQEVKSYLQTNMAENQFNSVFNQAQPIDLQGDTLILALTPRGLAWAQRFESLIEQVPIRLKLEAKS